MAQGRRVRQRTVAADERESFARRGAWRLTGMCERDPPRELVAVGISREDRPALRVGRRGDLPSLTLSWRAREPIVIGKKAPTPPRPAVACQREQGALYGIGHVHRHLKFVV